MIQLDRIDHINMRVRDLKESIHFYQELFGFSLKEQGIRNGKPWAIVGLAENSYLCLYEVGDKEIPQEGMTINHFGFHLTHFEEAVSLLKAKGIALNYGGIVHSGKSRSVYIEDPSGHEIELSEKIGGGLH